MSNADEDEVEDELEAMAAEMSGAANLPSVSEEGVIAPLPNAPSENPRERAQRRAKERDIRNTAEPMLA